MTIHCPQCNAQDIIKSGFAKNRQRFKCNQCNYQFTSFSKERGKPLWMKLEAVLMYMSGMSMNATAKILGVSAQSVLNWVRDFGEANYEKPTPESAVVVELDELWHFIQGEKNKLWVWKAYDRNTGRLIDWELGSRDSRTLGHLLERFSQWQITVYCTDNWKPYQQLLENHPDAFHVISKKETIAIERNNSDNRHWFARFHRRTKVVSKSKHMVDLSMALFAKFRVNGSIELLRNWRLTLLS
ncbi:IS1 family transposase [[Leptolyngbya] sp. PCC 7376]|uniref:IS1 family transposase n=1 Tax=[Leptolyngbya] sp. PCC 7376 TaxID=111781 RepID=UPI0028F45678|nr:IS1 family transposase [[Leptolyngbya] sp. PCC 7376]